MRVRNYLRLQPSPITVSRRRSRTRKWPRDSNGALTLHRKVAKTPILARSFALACFPPIRKQVRVLLPLLFKPKMLRHKIVHHEHCTGGRMDHLNDLRFAKVRNKVGSLESSAQLPHAVHSRRVSIHSRGRGSPQCCDTYWGSVYLHLNRFCRMVRRCM